MEEESALRNIPTHGTSLDLPSRGRNQILRVFLRWLLHCLWCIRVPARRWNCNKVLCRRYRFAAAHVGYCNNYENCLFPYCRIATETLHHWRNCALSSCQICAPMAFAFYERMLPDPEMNPIPNARLNLSLTIRKGVIDSILRSFIPDPDFSDINNERVSLNILRARIIEGEAYRNSTSYIAYGERIEREVIAIKGPPM